jgi:hypothetical protein
LFLKHQWRQKDVILPVIVQTLLVPEQSVVRNIGQEGPTAVGGGFGQSFASVSFVARHLPSHINAQDGRKLYLPLGVLPQPASTVQQQPACGYKQQQRRMRSSSSSSSSKGYKGYCYH